MGPIMNLELLVPTLQNMPALPQNPLAGQGTSGFAQTMAAFQASVGNDSPQAPVLADATAWAEMTGSPFNDPAPLTALLAETVPGATQPLSTLTDGELVNIAERLSQMAVHGDPASAAEVTRPIEGAADTAQPPNGYLASAQPASHTMMPAMANGTGVTRPLAANSAPVASGALSPATPALDTAASEDMRQPLTDSLRPATSSSGTAARTDLQAGTGNMGAVLPQVADLRGAGESRQDLRVDSLSSLLSSQSAPSPAATSTQSAALTAPLNTPNWSAQLSQQMITMGQRGGEQLAELRLNPHDLGPLTVSLKITEHGAQAQFLSANAAVRQAVEQAIPQLRDALAEQGISLGETSVGEHRQHQEQQHGQTGNRFVTNGGASDPTEQSLSTASTTLSPASVADGRVDLYA